MIAYQPGFEQFGVGVEVAGDVVDRVRVILESQPETRADYNLLWVRYLETYHHLSAAAADELLRVLDDAPGFRTVANRAQELFARDARLQPPATVMQRRQAQRTQGRVR